MAPRVEMYTLLDSALSQTLAKIRIRGGVEAIPASHAFGRVSAEEIRAPHNVPPYPVSHWDGHAVISIDLEGASDSSPVSLKVVGIAGPGDHPKLALRRGEAFQVATGAGLPSGADSVVPKEVAEVQADRILVKEPSPVGNHVYAAGEDLMKGEVILRKGQVVRVQDVGQLLATGFRRVTVRKKPKVAVLATGSELTDAQRPEKGKVVNSHSPIFLQLCEGLGCVPVDMGIARDERTQLATKLRGALAKSDLVLTLGGTSVGERDHVAAALEAMAPDLLIHGTKMDRGRVAGVGVVGGKPVVMMPGPIQGAMNAFVLLGIPIIEVLSGTKGRISEFRCAFRGAWQARSRFADFRKVVYVKLEGGPEAAAVPLRAETESMKILTEADGYVVVPENVTRIEDGEKVMVRLLPGFSYA
jgi:molybdopterin molybdotransferase